MKPAISVEAERDLDGIEAWLLDNWGPLAAANIIDAVLDRIATRSWGERQTDWEPK